MSIAGPLLPQSVSLGVSVQFRDSFLILGGRNKNSHRELDTIYEFEPDSESWIERDEKMKIARYTFTAFLVPDSYANCT